MFECVKPLRQRQASVCSSQASSSDITRCPRPSPSARTLSEVELMAREYIAATTDVVLDDVSVDVILEQIGAVSGIRERIDRINAERREASQLEEHARADAADLAQALVRENVPLRDVGTALNVSHQRAHQLIQG